jgi:hypothetical protein
MSKKSSSISIFVILIYKVSNNEFLPEFSVPPRPGSSVPTFSVENKKRGNSEKYRIPPTGAENYQAHVQSELQYGFISLYAVNINSLIL